MAYIQIPAFSKSTNLNNDTEFVIVVDGKEYLVSFKTLSEKFGNSPELLAEINAEIEALRNIVDAFPTENPAAPIALKIADTPIIDGIYKPTEAGVYLNAGGLEYDPTEGITYFIRTQGVWTKDVTPVNFIPTGVVEEGNTQAVSGGEVFNKTLKYNDVGIELIPIGTNLMQDVVESDINDSDFWQDGYLSQTGGVLASVQYKTTINYITAFEGLYPQSWLFYSGNARLVCYDIDKNMISAIPNNSGGYRFDIELPAGTRYIRYSHLIAQNKDRVALITTTTNKIVTDKVFLNKEAAKEVSYSVINDFGIKPIPIGTNFIKELTNSELTDTDIWGDGYYYEPEGKIFKVDGWYHSKKKYPIIKGEYVLKAYIRLNARIVIYDSKSNITRLISNPSGSYLNTPISITEDECFISFSHGNTQEDLQRISLTNTDIIYPDVTDVTNGVSGSNYDMPISGNAITSFVRDTYKRTFIPKNKIPIATFISDDGHALNDWFIDLLDSKGVKATFLIITSRAYDDVNFMNWDRLRELQDNGHDIGGHTHTHPHLGDIPIEDVQFEIERCRAELLSKGFTSKSFTSPYSSRTDDTSRIIRKYFNTDWKGVRQEDIDNGNCCNTSPIENFPFLKRIAQDAQINGVSTLASCKQALDVAVAKKEWVAFTFHPQYPEYNPNGNPDGYMQRRQDVSDLIDYILDNGVQLLTVREALEVWGNPVNIGNNILDARWYSLGMDGTEAGNYFS